MNNNVKTFVNKKKNRREWEKRHRDWDKKRVENRDHDRRDYRHDD